MECSMPGPRGYHVRLNPQTEEALNALMARTGMNWSQAINFSIVNTARGHDGYYAQMAAYQSAIAASAALFASQTLCQTHEDRVELMRFANDLAKTIHGPPPSPPNHLVNTAAHTAIGKAFFDALDSHYGPSS